MSLKWNELPENLRNVLPDNGLTYIIDKMTSLTPESFTGAPAYAFETACCPC